MRPYEANVKEFPRPWRWEEDWQYEVRDATGKLVASTPYQAVAAEIVAAANAEDFDWAALAELRKLP